MRCSPGAVTRSCSTAAPSSTGSCRCRQDLAVVVFDSGVRHTPRASGYATRRAELERALPALGGARPSEVTVEEAEAAARAAGVDEVARRRLRHVVSENERVRACVRALEAPRGPDRERARRALPRRAREPPRRLRGLDPRARPARRARLRRRRRRRAHDGRRLRRLGRRARRRRRRRRPRRGGHGRRTSRAPAAPDRAASARRPTPPA